MQTCPVVVLVSGSGSNLQALIDTRNAADPAVDIRAVISNIPDAFGLERAARAGIPGIVVNHRDYPDRESFDAELIRQIDALQPELVILAGFMRILTKGFVEHYAGRLINIHPSLLPRYPGLNTHARAIENGDSEAGATVHFVTPEVDGGPIIIQARVAIEEKDTADTLAARVLQQEHVIYPCAVRWFADQRLTIENGQVLLDGEQSPLQEIAANEH
jgi:phosphoribosylglycinamide formyltransferase-1